MNSTPQQRSILFVFYFLFLWLIIGLFINSTNQIKFNINHVALTTLAERKSFDLDPSILDHIHSDLAVVRGKVITNRHPGLSMVGATAYTLLKPLTGGAEFNFIWTASWISFLTSTLSAALISLFTAIGAMRLGLDRRLSLVTGTVTIFSSTLFPHSTIIHHDMLLTLFVLINILWITGIWQGRGLVLLAGFLAGFGASSSGLGAIALPGIALAVIIYYRKKPPVIIKYGVFAAIGLLPLLLYNWHYGESPFTSPYILSKSTTNFPVFTLKQVLTNLRFYLISPEGSFLVYSPVATLGLLGLFVSRELRRKLLPAILCVFISTFSYLLVMPSVGWCEFGPRFLMPFIPLFMLGFVGLHRYSSETGRLTLTIFAVLAAAGFIINLPAVLTTAVHCQSGFSSTQEWTNVIASRYSIFPMIKPMGTVLILMIAVTIIYAKATWSATGSLSRTFAPVLITIAALVATIFIFASHGRSLDQRNMENEVKMFPNSFSAHYVLAENYLRQDRRDEAVSELKIATKLDPEHSGAHFKLGFLYLKMLGFEEEATREFRYVIKYSKDPAEISNAHVNIGNIHARKGRLKKAVIQYERALALNPYNSVARENLSKLRRRMLE